MFSRLADQYRSVVQDLVMSLHALASSLQKQGLSPPATAAMTEMATTAIAASFVAELGEQHLVRFLVSDFGISWVESRNGRELVKFEGAEAIQELQRIASSIQERSSIGSTPEIASR
jgi:hypothetical protein